ncbi:uncharacterized protein F5891DRAFT_1131063 [Suillus fuscotomentosus]|uniref:BTB domain-containing protein n=1 Tax=Suillus fuscotomentosus TaxID=1912939 RepID=A0AAD4HFB7_9AGAM|nr:uncharacterized protein F5891DRAFT_1131063 [Suillus fuscotomentosus]KAG1894101.1 hypothetical protein F5891DRAFT_1131063 [Suillus fuscotomentosus]
MFAVGGQSQPIEGTDGSSDDHPIIIPELSTNMFKLYLSVAYNSWKPEGPTHSDVIDLLRFSNKFMSQKTRDIAIHHFHEQRFRHKPYDLLALCLEFSITKFFVPVFQHLIEFRIRDIPGPMRKKLGFELLDEHRRIVACEEPPLIEHAACCTNNTACSIDWWQLWWNSMARFLLDGRNPQVFREAVDCFQELGFEIGRVNPECWKMLLQTVKKGTAFHLAYDLIEEMAQQLSAALITEPDQMLTSCQARHERGCWSSPSENI